MSEKLLVPRIRFKEFTNAWEQWKARGILLPYRQKNDKNLALISYSVSNKEGFVDQKEFFDEGGKAVYADKKNSLIISFDTFAYNPSRINVGSIALFKNTINGLVSPIYEVFKVSANSNPDFIYLWFKSECFNKIVANNSNKSVRDTLNLKQFEDNLLNLPVLQEQNKIAKLFSNLDSLIALHQRKLSSLKNLKNRLLDKMFCDEKSQFPSIRFKEFTNAWEQWKVGDMFTVGRGSGITKRHISYTKHGDFKYPVYTSQTVNDGLLGYYNQYNSFDAISWTTDGANAGSVSLRKGLFYSTSHCGVLSEKAFKPNDYFVIVLSKNTQKNVTWVAMPMLTTSAMSKIEAIISTDKSEQEKISLLIRSLDSLITLHQRKLNSLKNIKNTLLEKMFV
ncbi:restriction endonuclease subunit S [Mycoplasmopsis agalactiae]|uniref:restriction endonuclease subunit S n=1 Tax=Mycoplasmopsis agalactiae TaxID=2110 RepID=UPI001F88D87F|nr:restriction endonuclease subunit S [Mycoplasmopsis agalactiae]MCE6115415.1 restriction endonuclease subunit S [Mycoplasmopsis agalactiae]